MKTLLITIAIVFAGCTAEGDEGLNGEMGLVGNDGTDGLQGPQGDKGDKGDPGVDGQQGVAGQDGVDGLRGATGVQGETGPQGAPGAPGSQGATGATGATGNQGGVGPAGIDGAQVVLFSPSGTRLGYPMMIDRGSGMDIAFYAGYPNAVNLPASYPLGFIVARKSINTLTFSGSNCTGQAYASSSEVGTVFKDVLSSLQGEDELWRASGGASTKSHASMRFGNSACQPSSGSRNSVKMYPTQYSIEKFGAWEAVSF